MQSRHSKLYCLCSRDIQNFIVCAVATFKTLLFVQSRHSKLYCLCSRDIQNFIVCAVATFKTLLFVQSRHSKLYCLCSRDIQNFIVCAVETFETLLFVQSRHSKLYCLCSRAIRNFLVCVSLLGLRSKDLRKSLNGRLYVIANGLPSRFAWSVPSPRKRKAPTERTPLPSSSRAKKQLIRPDKISETETPQAIPQDSQCKTTSTNSESRNINETWNPVKERKQIEDLEVKLLQAQGELTNLHEGHSELK